MSPNDSIFTTDTSVSRRTVLRAGAAAAAIGSIAGCSSLPGGGFNYSQYLVDPDELDRDSYNFQYSKPSTIAENEDELEDEIYESAEGNFSTFAELTGVDYDEIQHAVEIGSQYSSTGAVSIVTASFEKEDVVDEIEDNDFDDDDEVSGYETFLNEGETQGFAIQDDTIMHVIVGRNSQNNKTPDEVLELIIGAENGEEDRYADAYESFEVLTSNLDTAASLSGSASDEESDLADGLENVVAIGGSLSINGETSNRKQVFVHEEQDDIDVEEVEETLEDSYEDAEDYSVSSSGRATIIQIEYDTDELSSVSGSSI